MTYPIYPETEDEAIRYAEALATVHGEEWVAVRLPAECTARHGMKFAGVHCTELQSYLDLGATRILRQPNVYWPPVQA